MDNTLEKSIRNGLIVGGCFSLISLFYGAIYNTFIVEGLEITLGNILLAILGVIAVGITFFAPVFIVSLMIYYFKDRNPK